eukprot:m51a1_g5581 hypothetical protein (321) ;mRNA; r:628726-630018
MDDLCPECDRQSRPRPHHPHSAVDALYGEASSSPHTPPPDGACGIANSGDSSPCLFSPDQEKLFSDFMRWQRCRRLMTWPRRIILVRHAESLANTDPKIYSTVPDNKIPLSTHGVLQAREAGIKLKDLVGDQRVVFFVSPFKRSRMTLEEIVKAFDSLKYYVREDPRLREQEWGNYQDPNLMARRMKERREVGSFYYRFPEGESGCDVYDRVSSFLETLFRQFDSGGCAENIIIVTHGITLRLILMRYFRWSVEMFHDLWNPGNTDIIELLRDDGMKTFRLATPIKSETQKYLLPSSENPWRGSTPDSLSRGGTPCPNIV